MYEPEYLSDPRVIALQAALFKSVPFYSGICAIPDYQRTLYYRVHDETTRRIDFTKAGTHQLEELYRACKPAEFGRNSETVLDKSYRKAGKMDLTSFATLFHPHDLGIHAQVTKALATESFQTMDMELYKLNVYGQGDFFKAHKDTPRSQDMFGSLVVVLPTPHEGGQFVLRHGQKEWTLDFADKIRTATEPSACFVAFYCDIEHEVLPVTSGHRVTLTYNLYRKPTLPRMSTIHSPHHLELKRALIDLLKAKSTLQNGGYLGFGLVHQYVHTGHDVLEPLLGQLKGSDRALADVCDDLGLRYSLRLFYRAGGDCPVPLITTKKLHVERNEMVEWSAMEWLQQALEGLTIEQVEGVELVGRATPAAKFLRGDYGYDDGTWLRPFFRTPITEVMEITPMESSVDVKTSFVAYGNEATLGYFYGTACMLIAVGPAKTRRFKSVV